MAIQVLDHYKIGSSMTQIGLALFIALLAYTGLYIFFKISNIELKNFISIFIFNLFIKLIIYKLVYEIFVLFSCTW